jgi:NADPH-dependent F420 reductase
MTDNNRKTVAVLGGTGKEGKGLAYRWAKAGIPVIIGSRNKDKANEVAQELKYKVNTSTVDGEDNLTAALKADIIVISVPYSAHQETLESIKSVVKGKILIDVTVPLNPPKVTRVQMPPAGSAAQEAREIVGEGVEIAAAFQNISYEHLNNDNEVDCDVLVTGTSKETRIVVLDLVKSAGLNGWDAGALENSMVAEGLTSVLIHINKTYGSTHAGVRITGVVK